MPRESAEQLFTMLPMKTQGQGVNATLVAALNLKVAGKHSSIIRIYRIQKPLTYGSCLNVFKCLFRKLPNLADS
ncbi:uncharacterized protein EAE98_007323 [Botrytis deweyae]|uniref:Uncharacterized protein n=1 Tax=Botrytis deweyae TaxID=2478750 RepID=A0ABQ7IHQ7_9HELO|nr:uncharacterized protein EAE98_007323 [Botrytis deweyae]KAF7924272.1 hypothetical protein EAE98_007323 [Botrytis deweyae]